ncbi:MAG: phenylacetate--CoA ligase family protein [Clostridia bacterium]|nr:MAG: phenylacetate--CoA ligase family protein [Clostridia bacterium]
MEDRLYWNEAVQGLSEEGLRRLESERLLAQLQYTLPRSPFYQRKLKEAGVELGDIKGIEDLPRLPFTYKDELRRSQEISPPLGEHACVSMEEVVRIYSTSGTTGRPSFIGLTRNDVAVWNEISAQVYWTAGLRMTDRIVLGLPGGFFVASAIPGGFETIGAAVIPAGGSTDRVISAFQNLKAECLFGTPSYAIYLEEYLLSKGIDPRSLGIKRIYVGGEPGGGVPHIRRRIEEAFGADLLEQMGNGDMAPAIFSECQYKTGMHFCAQGYVAMEIINPDTGESLPLKKGTKGELVYSSLQRECIPLFRFRTRDLVEVTETNCPCGRSSVAIRCIGRTDDMIIVQAVNVFPSAVRDVVASFRPRTNGEMLIVLDEPGPQVKPPVRIQVEYGPEAGDLSQLKQELEQHIREKLIFRADVELVPAGTLPRSEYKASLVRKPK